MNENTNIQQEPVNTQKQVSTETTRINQQPPPLKPVSALAVMASRLSIEPAKLLSVLKSTVFAKATDDELAALVMVANEYQLNPLLKEIYAFPNKGGGITPIVSVDGWNKMLIRQPNYDGKKFTFERDENGALVSCTATIYVKGREHPEEITEYFEECKRFTDNWKNMPCRMLRNRTLCQASRMAFGFSGVYHEDEAESITVKSTVIPTTEPTPKLIVATKEPQVTPQNELQALVVEAGFDFNNLQKFGVETGNITEADSLAAWEEIPTEEAKRLLKNKTGLLAALAKIKG